MKDLRPEHEVLFRLLRGELRELPAGFDAAIFFRLLQRHKLLPLVEELFGLVDEEIKDTWKSRLYGWVMRSDHLLFELLHVTQLLNDHGITVVSLKGPSLSYALYGNTYSRFYNDIDIVVQPELLGRASEILCRNGYLLQRPDVEMDHEKWTEYFRGINDVGLVNREKKIYLELHRGIYVPGLLEQDEEELFFERTRTIDIKGTSIQTLLPAQYFLYLCFHGAKHMYFRLCWLRDVAEFMKREKIDYVEVESLVKHLKLEKLMGMSLKLAEKYFGVAIPDVLKFTVSINEIGIMTGLADKIILGPGRARFFKDILPLKERHLKEEGIDKARVGDWLNRVWLSFLLRPRWTDRARYISQTVSELKIRKR